MAAQGPTLEDQFPFHGLKSLCTYPRCVVWDQFCDRAKEMCDIIWKREERDKQKTFSLCVQNRPPYDPGQMLSFLVDLVGSGGGGWRIGILYEF